MCACPSDNVLYNGRDSSSTVYGCLRELLIAELTSTPTNIQQLQNIFYFSAQGAQSVYIGTNMTVIMNVSTSSTELVPTTSIFVSQFPWTHYWYEDNFMSVMRQLFPAQYYPDPVSLILVLVQSFGGPQLQYLQLNIQLNCASRGDPFQQEVLAEIWKGILQWVSL